MGIKKKFHLFCITSMIWIIYYFLNCVLIFAKADVAQFLFKLFQVWYFSTKSFNNFILKMIEIYCLTVVPCITNIINSCLKKEIFPECGACAMVYLRPKVTDA